MSKPGLVLQLQEKAADPSVSVSELLRLAKMIAVKLDLPEALTWIDAELNGYMGQDDVPPYRKVEGQWEILNPYRGWQRVQFEDKDTRSAVSVASIGQPIVAMEAMTPKADRSGSFEYSGGADFRASLVRKFGWEARMILNKGGVLGILEHVRNMVLDWALKLEKAGVIGEGLSFSTAEKREAATVTHTYFIQNAGVVGDVSGGTVENRQTARIEISGDDVLSLVHQARASMAALPLATQQALSPVLDQLEQTAAAGSDTSRVSELLRSARTICEGAAGNLVASGIVGLISKLLG